MAMLDKRPAAFLYIGILAFFFAALAGILSAGKDLKAAAAPAAASRPAPSPRLALDARRHLQEPLALLLVQILVIVGFTRVCARGLRAFHQPEVIGEVIGGILLGPSVLGLLWPEASGFLFPPASLAHLQLLSQLGLVVFMFVVGMELNTDSLKREVHTAVLISHASVVVPFLLGSFLSLALYGVYAPAGVPFSSFCLFMGIAMSITAFPVLARIIQERGLTRTALGTMALTSAAVSDLTAWCGLAFVVGIADQGSTLGAVRVTVLCALYIAGMTLLVGPVYRAWAERRELDGTVGRGAVAAALALVLASALVTELIGIHALFGAFLAGTVMPRGPLRQALRGRLEDFSALVLLPIFFALTGLRTQLGLLSDASAWSACSLIVLVAVAGKLGGTTLVGRAAGMPWRDAAAVGTLMNTRGLIELVVLNIGCDLGIIPPVIFTMMVVMALATTLMTGPLLGRLLKGTPLEALAAQRASA